MNNYLQKFSLEGRVVFIAGGAGLIGTEISKAVSSAGAKTVILDINKEKGLNLKNQITSDGYLAYFEYFDITNLNDTKINIDKLEERYKRIDVWINSAYPKTKDWLNTVENLSLSSWRKNVDMHLNAYAWISRYVALKMKKAKIKGSIINFGSIYGVQSSDFTVYEGTKMTTPMTYAAIKGGIVNLTRYLAAYFGKYGIRANTICPGGVVDSQNKVFIRNYSRKVPLKRMGRPDEIASVVLFLSSDAASYINGATIMVDGGLTII